MSVEGVGPERAVEVELPAGLRCRLGDPGDELGGTLRTPELGGVDLGHRGRPEWRRRVELERSGHDGERCPVAPSGLEEVEPCGEATVTYGTPGTDHVGPHVDTHLASLPQGR